MSVRCSPFQSVRMAFLAPFLAPPPAAAVSKSGVRLASVPADHAPAGVLGTHARAPTFPIVPGHRPANLDASAAPPGAESHPNAATATVRAVHRRFPPWVPSGLWVPSSGWGSPQCADSNSILACPGHGRAPAGAGRVGAPWCCLGSPAPRTPCPSPQRRPTVASEPRRPTSEPSTASVPEPLPSAPRSIRRSLVLRRQ